MEFQKRGLPHAHIVLWLVAAEKLLTLEDIDSVISAKIPDKEADPKGYKAVSQLMMHGPCGPANPKCPCMSNGRCTKLYPKSVSDKTVVNADGSESSSSVTTSSSDEVSNYLLCPYVSATKSCWRLFEFPIHHREPFVQPLYSHLENEQEVRFRDNETLLEVVHRVDPDGTMFIQWMLSDRLANYPGLPELNIVSISKYKNELLLEEMMYDREQLRFKANEVIHCLNQMQRIIFDQIVESVDKDIGGFYFMYGPGGTGKTFLWSTLIARLRGEGKMVLPVASSGIASLLIDGGRTAHSRFKIPIDADKFSCCEIK
ncbi:uncharacterized protein LOC141679735 [Apium graveolens]|uniref:uncharacterized protein LOC141679735 n=1 Tax=Apium graveolens TaxID=4045 RepID=UPI003D7A1048